MTTGERKLTALPFRFRVSRVRGAVTLGGVAEWSCSGLQSRVRRFDSDPRLQFAREGSPPGGYQCAEGVGGNRESHGTSQPARQFVRPTCPPSTGLAIGAASPMTATRLERSSNQSRPMRANGRSATVANRPTAVCRARGKQTFTSIALPPIRSPFAPILGMATLPAKNHCSGSVNRKVEPAPT